MDFGRRPATSLNRPTFISPSKNRTFEVLNVLIASFLKFLCEGSGSVAHGAIGDDRLIQRNIHSPGRGIRIDLPRIMQMTHLVFAFGSDIEQERWRAMLIFQPLREFTRLNAADVWIIMPDFVADRPPGNSPARHQTKDRADSKDGCTGPKHSFATFHLDLVALVVSQNGGRGGIRTHGWFNPTHDFESCALNRTQPPFLCGAAPCTRSSTDASRTLAPLLRCARGEPRRRMAKGP